TLNGSLSPKVLRVDVGFERFASLGSVVTQAFLPPDPLVHWTEFRKSDNAPAGTSVSYAVHDGTDWVPVRDGESLMFLPAQSLIVRAELTTANRSLTPTVSSFSVRYEYFGSVAVIQLDPSSLTLTADQTQTFTARAWDAWGHELTTFGCTWRTNDPNGRVDGNGTLTGTYYPGKATGAGGPWWVRCYNSDGTIWGSADVTVTPGLLSRIVVRPDPVLIPMAQSRDIVAEGRDAKDNAFALTSTTWSATIGQLSNASAGLATLVAPPVNTTGMVIATQGGITGRASVLVTEIGVPMIRGVVPDEARPEDSQPRKLDLSAFAANQADANDTSDNLKWYLTGVDTRLYTVFGEHVFGQHNLTFTPKKDASGVDAVTLWLEDRDGARSWQNLTIAILPRNDPPAFADVPALSVRFGVPFTFNFLPYVRDVDTPPSGLTLAVDDAHVASDGLNATYTYDSRFLGRTLWVRHRVNDGLLFGEAYVRILVTGNTPPRLNEAVPFPEIPPVTEDTVLQDALPQSLAAYFVDNETAQLEFDARSPNLSVWVNDTGSKVTVDIAPKPNFWGTDRITFHARDEGDAVQEHTVRVTVNPVPDPPTLAWRDNVTVDYGRPYRLDLSPFTSDPDTPPEALTLTTNDTSRALVDRLGVTFLYLGSSPYNASLRLSLTDGTTIVTQDITVHVVENRPPEIRIPFDPIQFPEDTTQDSVFDLAARFQDEEDKDLTFQAISRNVAVGMSGTVVTLTPARDWFGQEFVVFRATDSGMAFTIATLLVDVTSVDDPPILNIPAQMIDGGVPTVLDLRPFVADADNETAELRFATNHPNANAAGFQIYFNFPAVERTVLLRLNVTDGIETRTVEFTVTVLVPSFLNAIFWPWSGLGALLLAAVGYVAWTRLTARRYLFDDLFLIGREGRLIMHETRRLRADRDEDILAGMLTAIMSFVRDSFREEDEHLKRFEFGDRHVAVEKGTYVYCAAFFAGDVPPGMPQSMRNFLADVEDRYGGRLSKWSGDVDDLPGLKAMMEHLGRHGRYRRGDWIRLERGPRLFPLRLLRR
ncbi:MAG: hypothetical protein HY557_00595, partial [Euryarchaeota archaeon]|nr:hypothetical protein [Euryarchaeota archaeon]